ncbi:MAG: hypothetical protein JWN04_6896, partial [Myxococcaceae bacterium]|nr:hypothetical protein [Myxococcaceae bacterium]
MTAAGFLSVSLAVHAFTFYALGKVDIDAVTQPEETVEVSLIEEPVAPEPEAPAAPAPEPPA